MKIKKYRPNFFTGFEDVYYEVNSKDELLASDLCKYSIDNGFEICIAKERDDYGLIMAVKQDQSDKEGAEWWVLAIIYDAQDVETLANWLTDFDSKRKEYKNKIRKDNK